MLQQPGRTSKSSKPFAGWSMFQATSGWQFFLALSFSVFSVFQSSLCCDPKRQNFSFLQRQWLLFRWIFWVCILGFSIALISNVARILIHKWTVEAAWQLKIPAGFWALAFPSCFEICFDLALSILFVHVSKVHDLDSLNDPLIEHVLLDTGSRPWKRPYATFTPRTRHDVTSDWWWMALHKSWATITFTFLLALLGCKRAQSWAIFSCVLQSYIGLPGSWSAWPA